MNNDSEILCEIPPKKYGLKATLAQSFAILAQSFLFVGLGMNLSVPSIVIRDLYGNSDSDFSITIAEASWYGSLIYLLNPIGCLSSGILQGKFGVKKCMLFANIPSAIGWLLLYSTNSPTWLCASTILMGFSAGFGSSSTASYVGEITEPRLRGSLGSIGSTAMRLGILLIYIMSYFFEWRTVSLISTLCPVICLCLVFFIPESPIWLIAKGEHDKAEKSLCWLRGWVQSETVKSEFLELIHYNEVSGTLGGKVVIDTDNGLFSKLAQFKEPSVYRPFKLLIIFFFISYITGITPAKPFISNVMTEIGVIDNQNLFLIIFAVQQNMGSVILLFTLRRLGKRFLTFLTLSINSTLLILFGLYTVAIKYNFISPTPWIPLTMLNIIYFCGGFGLTSLPWILLNEVFPNKSRGIATSTCTALGYLLLFTLTKLFLSVEMVLSFEYTMVFSGFIGFFGLVYFYLYLPETENKTLLEIEAFFASNSKGYK